MFSYTVEKNASKQTFEMVCRLIESHFTGIVKEKLLEDGTLMKTDLTDIVAEKRGVLNQSVELDIPSGCHKIKFFLFGSEKNIIPFSKPLICYVNN